MSDDKTISVKAFKSMIEGMDMVSGDDWTPTTDQWKRIREKIEQLEETVERVIETRPADVPGSRLAPTRPAAVVNSDNPWENGTGQMPDVQGSIPDGPVEMGETMSSLPAPGAQKTRQVPRTGAPATGPNPEAPMVTKEGQQVKTPDIDSSQGYDSPFA